MPHFLFRPCRLQHFVSKNPTTVVTFLSFYLEIQNCKHVFNLLQKIIKSLPEFLAIKSEVLDR